MFDNHYSMFIFRVFTFSFLYIKEWKEIEGNNIMIVKAHGMKRKKGKKWKREKKDEKEELHHFVYLREEEIF